MTVLVVMGVTGAGKTTIGEHLAKRLGWQYQEGDALHPPANVAKMAGGTPLTDEDRWPWLARIASLIDQWRAAGMSGVVTCSALKRSYRDILIGNRNDVLLVFLRGDRTLLASRLASRRGHFMPPTLLDSQIATLEAPTADEQPIVADVGGAPDGIVADIMAQLQARPGALPLDPAKGIGP